MSIVLETADGRELKINAWNWGVLHHRVAGAKLFSADEWEPKRFNGGGELDGEKVQALAAYLRDDLLPLLREGERLFYDGAITDAPDDGTFYREESELWKNYSLHHAVLVRLIEFLDSAAGPVKFI